METLTATDVFIADFIEDMVESFEGHAYDTFVEAHGRCLQVTHSVCDRWADHPRVKVAYAQSNHEEKPSEYWFEKNQFSNHYASLIDDSTVIDFTLRQFVPDAAYPAIMPYGEWVEALSAAWEDKEVKHAIGDDPCYMCDYGVSFFCLCTGNRE